MLLKSRVFEVFSRVWGDFSCHETFGECALLRSLIAFAGDRTISSCRKGDRIEYEDFKHSVGRPQNAGVLPMILFDSTRLPLTPWLATAIE